MNIRYSKQEDIQAIMNLVHQAQKYFKDNGINQWQDGYPHSQQISNDIERQHSFVLVEQDIIGTMYFAIENDKTYNIIDGQWLTHNQPYAVIHRIVVDENIKGRGTARKLLNYAEKECQKNNIQSIRIDTHEDNLSMQAFLTKNGFKKCGFITLESGAPRVAFEKMLNK
jgi:ribosomal protein S18 acetylase RimI-like enzyme